MTNSDKSIHLTFANEYYLFYTRTLSKYYPFLNQMCFKCLVTCSTCGNNLVKLTPSFLCFWNVQATGKKFTQNQHENTLYPRQNNYHFVLHN